MKKIVFSECPYCGSTDLVVGFQVDKGAVFADVRGGVFGSKIEHVICRECGSIIHSRVLKADIFTEKENNIDLEISPVQLQKERAEQEEKEKPQATPLVSTEPKKVQVFTPNQNSK